MDLLDGIDVDFDLDLDCENLCGEKLNLICDLSSGCWKEKIVYFIIFALCTSTCICACCLRYFSNILKCLQCLFCCCTKNRNHRKKRKRRKKHLKIRQDECTITDSDSSDNTSNIP